MKILITGGNGYISKSIYNSLYKSYNITSITRKDLDLEDTNSVDSFFKNKKYDVVIHTAIQGGSRLQADTNDVLYKNLKMFYNLKRNKRSFKKFITFGSGAEATPSETPYGLSKFFINESILCTPNFFNLRIYGVFDHNEKETRFIKSCINNCINNQPIVIHQDKYMDFIYMKDLLSIIQHTILVPKNMVLNQEIDCCYVNKKYKLSEIAEIVKSVTNKNVSINLLTKDFGTNYTSDRKIKNFPPPLDFIGLENGIKETSQHLHVVD